MAISTTLIVVFIAYLALLIAVLYFCIVADPDESPVAMFLVEDLPRRSWSALRKVLGGKNLKIVEWIVDHMLILIYCMVVFGSWSIIFAYVYPWIDSQSYVSKFHKVVGYAVFASCVGSWRYASSTSPGIITAKTIKFYDHFPFDDLMFEANKVCPTRGIPRLARSKFDRFKYTENVPRFDHFCGWIHNTVGEENYRFFLLFLVVHVGMCVYGSVVLGMLFYGEILDKDLLEATFFNRYTGEEIQADKWIIFQYLFDRFFSEAGVFMIMAVMGIALGMFLGYHTWLTSNGLTTNESYKWGQVKKWYKTELRRYKEAVKSGDIVDSDGRRYQPSVTEEDVFSTAAPGQRAVETSPSTPVAETLKDVAVDPGPPPKNLYDRGLVENWKEVISPLSIRRRKSFAVQKSKAT
jgi:palmitoyltransferase